MICRASRSCRLQSRFRAWFLFWRGTKIGGFRPGRPRRSTASGCSLPKTSSPKANVGRSVGTRTLWQAIRTGGFEFKNHTNLDGLANLVAEVCGFCLLFPKWSGTNCVTATGCDLAFAEQGQDTEEPFLCILVEPCRCLKPHG